MANIENEELLTPVVSFFSHFSPKNHDELWNCRVPMFHHKGYLIGPWSSSLFLLPCLPTSTPSQDLWRFPEHCTTHKCLSKDWHFFVAKHNTEEIYIYILLLLLLLEILIHLKIWGGQRILIQIGPILKRLRKGNQTSHYLKITAGICYKCIFIIFTGFPYNFTP